MVARVANARKLSAQSRRHGFTSNGLNSTEQQLKGHSNVDTAIIVACVVSFLSPFFVFFRARTEKQVVRVHHVKLLKKYFLKQSTFFSRVKHG